MSMQKQTYVQIFVAVLLITATNGKYPNGILLSNKKNELLKYSKVWMNFKCIMPNEKPD